MKDRTKKQRRKWWDGLDENKKAKCVNYWLAKKAKKRLARRIVAMDKAEIKHNCSTCIHGMTRSCTDSLKWGCEYWFNPESSIMGLALVNDTIDATNRAEWLKRLKTKNPRLKVA